MLFLLDLFHDVSMFPDSVWDIPQQIVTLALLYDVWFYHGHRLLHTRWLKRIHSIHHNEPMHPSSGLYSHPLEYVLVFVGPALFLPWWLGYSWFVTWLWICGAVTNAAQAHTPGKTIHTLHHEWGNVNYGATELFDRLWGTFQPL